MKWVDNWFKEKWFKMYHSRHDCDEIHLSEQDTTISCQPRTSSLNSNGFRLQVYKASGGIVVETNAYDERKDRSYNGLHVVTDDKDLGEALAKIITYENLKL